MLTLLRGRCGFNTINKKRIYRKKGDRRRKLYSGTSVSLWNYAVLRRRKTMRSEHKHVILQAPCVLFRLTSSLC